MDDNPEENKSLIEALDACEHQIIEFRDELKRKLVTKFDLDEAEARIIAAIKGAKPKTRLEFSVGQPTPKVP